MNKIFKVVSQTEIETGISKKPGGGQFTKCTLVLQELGGNYADTYACELMGKDAQCKFYAGETVAAELRFRANESNGRWFQNVTADEIVKLKFS